jgi:hypothetical protein
MASRVWRRRRPQIIGGKVTEVTERSIVIEPDTGITLPPGLDISHVSVGSRILKRIRGHLWHGGSRAPGMEKRGRQGQRLALCWRTLA